VVLEGMAAGVPVIAAAAGGPTELITDGVDGLLTRPGDPTELAGAMRRLVDDPELRARLADAARERSREFTPERTAEQLLAVYRQVVSRA
jgi:glycosyltransferase involved in cell wall biosynthesis